MSATIDKEYDPTQEAIFEAEFYAMVAAHPHTPDDIKFLINCIMYAACKKLAEYLKEIRPDVDSDFIRDIYPYARLLGECFKDGKEHFNIMLREIEAQAPEVLNELQSLTESRQWPPSVERLADHPISLLKAAQAGEEDDSVLDADLIEEGGRL